MGCRASKPVLKKDGMDSSLHGNFITDSSRKVDDIYTRQNEIAKGSGSHIVHVKKTKFVKTTHSGYAMKLYDGTSTAPPDLVKEAEILHLCDHPNIVKLHELGKHKKKFTLVMDYCTGGTIEQGYPYTEKEASKILWQLLSAVDYLHKKNIVHRDINLSNVMFENEESRAGLKEKKFISNVKLIDFGCATKMKVWTSGAFRGTIKYLTEKTGGVYTMAPEVLSGKYTTQADMWSVGVCAYMLMTDGKRPFDGDTVEKTQTKIKCNAVDYSDIKSKQAVKFIKRCLSSYPALRVTASQALRDPWIIQTKDKVIMPNTMVASFQKFMRSSPVMRIAFNFLAYRSDPKAISEYRGIFHNLDTTQSNTLTRLEFVTGFKTTGFNEEELEELFTKLDVNCNDEILYTEFLAGTMANDEVSETQLQEVFEKMDTDNSGKISKKNLIELLGSSPSVKKSLDAMLENHKKMSFETFKGLFNHTRVDRTLKSCKETIEEEEEEEEE